MPHYFTTLTSIGIKEDQTAIQKKRIKILNYCAVFGVITALFFFGLDYSLGQLDRYKIMSFVIQLSICLAIFLLHNNQKHNIAKTLFLILVSATFIYNTNFAFKGFYGEYSYIILPLLSLFFFDSKLIHYIVLCCSVILFYVPNRYLHIYPEAYFGYSNVLFQFLGTFILVNYFKQQNQKNEKKLEEAYIQLEKRKQSELAHLQLKSLKAQMNPHFMFNAMNSIQNLVLKGNKQEAYDYLSKFASLIRENLNMSEKSFVAFDEELSLLTKYLELEKLRFKENFEYQIIGVGQVEAIKIPSMIIQPFAENAIKHGLLHKVTGTKKVSIVFEQKKDILHCTVMDNGVGIEASQRIKEQNQNNNNSFSTKAIQERLDLLKNYYKADIGIEYIPIEEGTKVIIKIPYTHE